MTESNNNSELKLTGTVEGGLVDKTLIYGIRRVIPRFPHPPTREYGIDYRDKRNTPITIADREGYADVRDGDDISALKALADALDRGLNHGYKFQINGGTKTLDSLSPSEVNAMRELRGMPALRLAA